MAGWNRKRVAAGLGGVIVTIAAVSVAWAIFARSAPAQSPEPKHFPVTEPSKTASEPLPPLTLPNEDPEVQPAQFTRPGSPIPAGTATPAARAIPDPPPPVVRIQVRVPADSPPGDDVKYLITVQNVSSADAHAVIVRNPLSDAVEPIKAEPDWDRTKSVPKEAGPKLDAAPKVEAGPKEKEAAPKEKEKVWKELVWSFGTLPAGKSKTIELTLRPKPDATEIKNLAYVRFEHGEAVTTRINKPALKVTKTAPKQTVRDEPYTVRVVVENTGKVVADNLRIVENVPTSAEVEIVTKGGKRTVQQDGQQWVWQIARLMPGERRAIEYRLTTREAKEAYTLTSVSEGKGVLEKAESRTQVLIPGIAVKLTGPVTVNPGESAKYEITVRNTGTLPSTNVRVTGTLPNDCKPTMKTEGGQLFRDAIQWTLPRLEPGEAQAFRFGIKATTSGRRVVVASVNADRSQRATDELATVFQGTAALIWESAPNPAALAVGRQGTFSVKVRNNGGEAARNVRIEVDLPAEVSLVQVTPNVRPAGNKLLWGPEVIPAYGEATYTITFEAKQSAQAWFKLTMSADCLGDRPMQTEKALEITSGVR